MPRPRLDDADQDAILDAAVFVIARRGVDRARLGDIARAVGRSTGTLQHYFGSRDDLLTAAFHRLNTVTGAEAERVAAATPDPWKRLVALVDLALRPGEDWKVWLEFWAACGRDPKLRAEIAEVYGVWRAPVRGAVEDGIADGSFTLSARLEEVVTGLLALIDGAALHLLLGIGGLEPEAARDSVLRLARGYLSPATADD